MASIKKWKSERRKGPGRRRHLPESKSNAGTGEGGGDGGGNNEHEVEIEKEKKRAPVLLKSQPTETQLL
ncbi:hypothetical protein SDJN03_23752, partial [Cucurbita argyrosperma subsp. sororia]